MKRIIKAIKGWIQQVNGRNVLFAVLIIACISEIIMAPALYFSARKRENENRAAAEMMRARVSRVEDLIMSIGDEPTSNRIDVQVAREAYDSLSESEQSEVIAYPLLRQAELTIEDYDKKIAEEERIRKEKEAEEKAAAAKREAEEKAAAERATAKAAKNEANNSADAKAQEASEQAQQKTSSQNKKSGSGGFGTEQILQDIFTDLTKIQNEVLDDVLKNSGSVEKDLQ